MGCGSSKKQPEPAASKNKDPATEKSNAEQPPKKIIEEPMQTVPESVKISKPVKKEEVKPEPEPVSPAPVKEEKPVLVTPQAPEKPKKEEKTLPKKEAAVVKKEAATEKPVAMEGVVIKAPIVKATPPLDLSLKAPPRCAMPTAIHYEPLYLKSEGDNSRSQENGYYNNLNTTEDEEELYDIDGYDVVYEHWVKKAGAEHCDEVLMNQFFVRLSSDVRLKRPMKVIQLDEEKISELWEENWACGQPSYEDSYDSVDGCNELMANKWHSWGVFGCSDSKTKTASLDKVGNNKKMVHGKLKEVDVKYEIAFETPKAAKSRLDNNGQKLGQNSNNHYSNVVV